MVHFKGKGTECSDRKYSRGLMVKGELNGKWEERAE